MPQMPTEAPVSYWIVIDFSVMEDSAVNQLFLPASQPLHHLQLVS